jgi:methyl-accepting chemotaxis protein
MFSILRTRSVRPPAPGDGDPPAAAVDGDALAMAIERIMSGDREAAVLFDGPAGLALGRLADMLRREREARLASVVGFAADAAATAAHVGWITDDIRKVADNSAKIAGSIDQLARTIAEISQSGTAVAGQVMAIGHETGQCVDKVRRAGEAMRLVNGSAATMADRLAVLDAAVAQIADMAKIIESISSQTNLLSLNATIEAARAGAAGRGFAIVAGEVKSLSSETAKATEQIRERIATLMAETSAIRQAVRESIDIVSSGDVAVQGAQQEMSRVSSEMGELSAHMSELAKTLKDQHQLTDQITANATQIAGKGQKVSNEVDGVINRLATAETGAWDFTLSFDARTVANYELLRAKAELAIWMRKLAAILVGLMKPDLDIADLGTRRLVRWCEGTDDDQVRANAAFAAIRSSADTAHAQARCMIERMQAKQWDAAANAYVAAEKAVADIVAQAGKLVEAAR